MRSGVPGFRPERLIEARAARGLTQVALADLSGRKSSNISRWEAGEQLPEVDALQAVAQGLNLPVSYFTAAPVEHGAAPMFARSMAATSKGMRARVGSRLRWAQDVSLYLQQELDLPTPDVPTLDVRDFREIRDEDIERMAIACREKWGLGLGPISDVLLVLENAGIIVVKEQIDSGNMDGLSNWSAADGRPYVFLATDKQTCVRSRMDAAHELGHLVLHRGLTERTLYDAAAFKEIERQAFAFAGAFLLPAESFSAEVWSPSLPAFQALKSRWKVSIGAMIMRCANLGIIDDEGKQRLFKHYSAKGWRKEEPLDRDLEPERPRLLGRSIKLLCDEKIVTRFQLLDGLRLYAHDVESLCNLPAGFFENEGSVSDIRLKRSSIDPAAPVAVFDADQISTDNVVRPQRWSR